MSGYGYGLDKAYEPQRFEIIGLTLIGSKLPDGTIKLDSGATFPEWPKVVHHLGIVIGLTRVTDQGPIRTGGTVQYAVYEDGLDDWAR